MKKFLLALLFLATPMLGQPSVPKTDTDHLKLATQGGLEGDTTKALRVNVYSGTSAPTSPYSGELWNDTTTTPPLLKRYNGATWDALAQWPQLYTMATLPGSGSNGQTVYLTDANTAATWDGACWRRLTNGACMTSNYTATYSTALLSAPGAPTVAAVGSGGSMTAGAHYVAVACVNSTGGMTTIGTPSASVTVVGNGSISVSSIPVCSGAATGRAIFTTKAGVSTSGQWYYNKFINDNSSTTATLTIADGSMVQFAPTKNFSAPLPSGFAVTISTPDGSGGCGSTGTSVACLGGIGASVLHYAATTDACVRLRFDLTGYNANPYSIQYRVLWLGYDGITSQGVSDMFNVAGFRAGTADNGINLAVNAAMVPSTAAVLCLPYGLRTSVAGALTGTDGLCASPAVSSFPFWVRGSRRVLSLGTGWSVEASPDGVLWTRFRASSTYGVNSGVGTANTTAETSFIYPSSPYTQFEISARARWTVPYWIEFDSFTLTNE